MNQLVTDYIYNLTVNWQAEICVHMRRVIYQAIPGVEERLQYGKPHYLKNRKYVCVLSTAKGWVSFTIFNDQPLDAPEGLFEISTNGGRKTLKIYEGQEVDYELLAMLVHKTANQT